MLEVRVTEILRMRIKLRIKMLEVRVTEILRMRIKLRIKMLGVRVTEILRMRIKLRIKMLGVRVTEILRMRIKLRIKMLGVKRNGPNVGVQSMEEIVWLEVNIDRIAVELVVTREASVELEVDRCWRRVAGIDRASSS
ncbi:hypothetical protein J6590_040782 [Homalodisca vitripennis]|nr:hypothetical protein J6590_040782 [Homalodisca vitripennis]